MAEHSKALTIHDIFRETRRRLSTLAGTLVTALALLGAITVHLRGGTATAAAGEEHVRPEDVNSMDGILAAIYDTISGPPGARDWARLRGLFLPEARLIPCGRRPDGTIGSRVLSLDEFIKASEPRLKEEGFFESEIHRKVDRFGAVAQVFSTYESRHAKEDAKPFARGINSIQLFFDGRRWWVTTIFWDSERPDQAIPAQYLPGSDQKTKQ
jgi:hypothetical protein